MELIANLCLNLISNVYNVIFYSKYINIKRYKIISILYILPFVTHSLFKTFF